MRVGRFDLVINHFLVDCPCLSQPAVSVLISVAVDNISMKTRSRETTITDSRNGVVFHAPCVLISLRNGQTTLKIPSLICILSNGKVKMNRNFGTWEKRQMPISKSTSTNTEYCKWIVASMALRARKSQEERASISAQVQVDLHEKRHKKYVRRFLCASSIRFNMVGKFENVFRINCKRKFQFHTTSTTLNSICHRSLASENQSELLYWFTFGQPHAHTQISSVWKCDLEFSIFLRHRSFGANFHLCKTQNELDRKSIVCCLFIRWRQKFNMYGYAEAARQRKSNVFRSEPIKGKSFFLPMQIMPTESYARQLTRRLTSHMNKKKILSQICYSFSFESHWLCSLCTRFLVNMYRTPLSISISSPCTTNVSIYCNAKKKPIAVVMRQPQTKHTRCLHARNGFWSNDRRKSKIRFRRSHIRHSHECTFSVQPNKCLRQQCLM